MTDPTTATEWLRQHAPHLLPEHLRVQESLQVTQSHVVEVEYGPRSQWSTRVELMEEGEESQ